MSESKLRTATPVSATHTHGTAPTATITGVAGVSTYISVASASSDKTGSIMLVKDGSTVVWQIQVGAGNYHERFVPPLQITAGADATVTIDSTSAGKANILGVQG